MPTDDEVKKELQDRLEKVYGAKVAEREEKRRIKRANTLEEKRGGFNDTDSFLSARFSELSIIQKRPGATTMILMTGLLATLAAIMMKNRK